MLRVLIADDHQVVRDGIASWLDSNDDIEVVGAVASGDEVVRLAGEVKPDVVVMDLLMPGMDGIEATRRVRAVSPETQVVVLTTYFDPLTVTAVAEAGARGYFLKEVAPADLVEGIRAVAAGGTALSPKVAAVLFERRTDPLEPLTPREREILDLIAQGHSNKQIARRLGISEKTVKAHCTRLFARIGAEDRTQAAIWALRNMPAAPPFLNG